MSPTVILAQASSVPATPVAATPVAATPAAAAIPSALPRIKAIPEGTHLSKKQKGEFPPVGVGQRFKVAIDGLSLSEYTAEFIEIELEVARDSSNRIIVR